MTKLNPIGMHWKLTFLPFYWERLPCSHDKKKSNGNTAYKSQFVSDHKMQMLAGLQSSAEEGLKKQFSPFNWNVFLLGVTLLYSQPFPQKYNSTSYQMINDGFNGKASILVWNKQNLGALIRSVSSYLDDNWANVLTLACLIINEVYDWYHT